MQSDLNLHRVCMSQGTFSDIATHLIDDER